MEKEPNDKKSTESIVGEDVVSPAARKDLIKALADFKGVIEVSGSSYVALADPTNTRNYQHAIDNMRKAVKAIRPGVGNSQNEIFEAAAEILLPEKAA